METEYIVREDLIKALNKIAMEYHERHVPMTEHDFRKLIHEVEPANPPTKVIAKIMVDDDKIREIIDSTVKEHDLVQVVRCRDCMYCEHRRDYDYFSYWYCLMYHCTVECNHYCGKGERKGQLR